MKAVIILGVIILILIIGFVILKPEKEQVSGGISLEEKEMIDAWIIENDLNQYGDPKDTVYMGGTPLFDEKTGQSIDKYEYILKNHPDGPWFSSN
ncbi:hypothetical protein A3G50_00830 [Candidatus Jorgensenbacteria bacterium RIFCSPLOWO2_12_FULL_42_11]|uniref:Uncharacterized protein n=1 Tax=Candidatus Jorgensenbacteria bacterium RIFCSPLOWO2_12_FULL_42_11 TaxID=1798473 RepID=A0A1F6C341_9BACT|nr:MAG: hypothetical protein A3G50_00830 [Candidatus Jorgensenbacteria bacterium RIFCSPLOWO2_12_FULL_42_11]